MLRAIQVEEEKNEHLIFFKKDLLNFVECNKYGYGRFNGFDSKEFYALLKKYNYDSHVIYRIIILI